MNSERHFRYFGVRYTREKIYDRGAKAEERKKVGRHLRFIKDVRKCPKKCTCKPDENGRKCNKKSELNEKGRMVEPDGTCPNASLHYECNPGLCDKTCDNQPLQNFLAAGIFPPVCVKNTGIYGLGLFSKAFIPANTVIGHYTGLVKCHEVGEHDVDSHYAFGIGTGFNSAYDLLIDAREYGNYLRYCNHSCTPNCSTQEVIIGTSFYVTFTTNQPIQPNTQLTISYGDGFFRFGLVCHCGSENCRYKSGNQNAPSPPPQQ